MPIPTQHSPEYQYLIQRTPGTSAPTVTLIDRRTGAIRARTSADLTQPGALRTALNQATLKATTPARTQEPETCPDAAREATTA